MATVQSVFDISELNLMTKEELIGIADHIEVEIDKSDEELIREDVLKKLYRTAASKNAQQDDKLVLTSSGILQVMDDLRSAEVDFITIGQYLQPSAKHYPLERYYHPDEFKELENISKTKGFLLVSSSPLTRSSYHADKDFRRLQDARNKKLECHPQQ